MPLTVSLGSAVLQAERCEVDPTALGLGYAFVHQHRQRLLPTAYGAWLTAHIAKQVPTAGHLVALYRQGLIDGGEQLRAPFNQSLSGHLTLLPLGRRPQDSRFGDLVALQCAHLNRASQSASADWACF